MTNKLNAFVKKIGKILMQYKMQWIFWIPGKSPGTYPDR